MQINEIINNQQLNGLQCSAGSCGGAGVFANVFVAARITAIRSPTDILMVTTMVLVWTVNQTRNLPGDQWSHCQS